MLIGRQSVELQAFLIQVIAVGNLPEQLGFTGVQAFRRKNEGFADRKKIRFGIEWIAASLGYTQAGKQCQQQENDVTHRQHLGVHDLPTMMVVD
ncbi:hypothetical protein D3C84_1082700 [compost metagenome]